MQDNYATILIKDIRANATDIMVGTEGACGEFALMLHDALSAIGEHSRIGLCCDDKEEYETRDKKTGDLMCWSHFVVEYKNKIYDIRGEANPDKLHQEFSTLSIVYVDRSEAERQAKSVRSDFKFLFNHYQRSLIERWRSIFERNCGSRFKTQISSS